MNTKDIDRLASELGSAFAIHPHDEATWVVDAPFAYGDGDHLPVFISRSDFDWHLTDRGMTVSHLYFDDFKYSEARHESIADIVGYHYAELMDDFEIKMPLDGTPSPLDIGYFLQLVSQVQAVAILSRDEREEREPYRDPMCNAIKRVFDQSFLTQIEENWQPPSLIEQKRGKYSVDMHIRPIEKSQPINMFVAGSSEKVHLAALTMTMVRPHDPESSFILAAHPDRVGQAAIDRFEDQATETDAISRVTPNNHDHLIDILRDRGVPVAAT